jgi:nitroreductase
MRRGYGLGMDMIETLLTRRSPALTGIGEPGPTAEQLTTILTIGARVPDHGKLVPWRFIVIEGEGRRRLSAVVCAEWCTKNTGIDAAAFEQGKAKWGAQLMTAPVVVAVVSSPKASPKIPQWEQVLSAGACCMNMLIAAKGLGLGAVWLSEWYAYDAKVLLELRVSGQERIAGFIHIGTLVQGREDRERPSLDAIVTRY